ncbi:hypothetical protein [Haloarcula salinisoli]|uniref:hypothetical protein n=1 Tax=Haloarcula salinisoli TaxID=2487746 RepID=UPI001F1AFCEB|nr:hypothetical protein [Halomicroarcula salinisoli]
MTDSNTRDELDAKRERNKQQRIEGIKRWVEYIKSEPPETWGHSRTRWSTVNSKPPKASEPLQHISNTSKTSLRT